MTSLSAERPAATTARARPRRGLDGSAIVIVGAAILLIALIVSPMLWLIVFAMSPVGGGAGWTLDNFVGLFTDATFVDPLLTTLTIAVSVGCICVLVSAPMAWLVARTDMPFASSVRMLTMASLVTPPFLGAIAWELLAAPNSGLLNQLWRWSTGAPPDQALLNIYSLAGVVFVISCYTFPYVFILVANALDVGGMIQFIIAILVAAVLIATVGNDGRRVGATP